MYSESLTKRTKSTKMPGLKKDDQYKTTHSETPHKPFKNKID
jgi:hypothetical protein